MFASKFKNQIFTLLLATGLTLATSIPTRADDIDIYYGPQSALGSEPLVMFTLDYRPNLGSIVCNSGECQFLIDEGYLPVQASYTFSISARQSAQTGTGRRAEPSHKRKAAGCGIDGDESAPITCADRSCRSSK